MKSQSLLHFAVFVAALHVVVLSMVIGLRHLGYILVAILSAILIWGVTFFLNRRKRLVGLIVGIVVGLAVQQVAYQAWKTELPDFWWPLTQFGALQFLVAFAIRRAIP